MIRFAFGAKFGKPGSASAGAASAPLMQKRAERGEADAARGALQEGAACERTALLGVEREESVVVAVHGGYSRVTTSSRLRSTFAVKV